MADGRIPARAAVASYRTEEHTGLVWACLAEAGDERRPAPRLPQVEAGGSHWLHVGEPMTWACQASRQIENFCDVAHFSTLHTDTFGNPNELVTEPYEVRTSDDGLSLAFDFPYVSAYGEGTAADTPDTYDMVFRLPGRAAVQRPPGRRRRSRLDHVHRHGADHGADVAGLLVHRVPHGAEVDIPAFEAVEDAVWRPDRRIVESQRPEALPLDLLEELHLPFDRFAVAYRRALTDAGFPRATREVELA